MAAVYFTALLDLAGDEGEGDDDDDEGEGDDDDDEGDDETGLVVIADVICITPSASKQREVEMHKSHFSEYGKAKD